MKLTTEEITPKEGIERIFKDLKKSKKGKLLVGVMCTLDEARDLEITLKTKGYGFENTEEQRTGLIRNVKDAGYRKNDVYFMKYKVWYK